MPHRAAAEIVSSFLYTSRSEGLDLSFLTLDFNPEVGWLIRSEAKGTQGLTDTVQRNSESSLRISHWPRCKSAEKQQCRRVVPCQLSLSALAIQVLVPASALPGEALQSSTGNWKNRVANYQDLYSENFPVECLHISASFLVELWVVRVLCLCVSFS